IKRELPLDLLEFFFLTPLPGSEDHQKLSAQGVWMDPDLNKYDLNHRVSHHPKMSDEEWEEAYRAAWDAYYTPEHVRTILRRTAANPRGRIANTISITRRAAARPPWLGSGGTTRAATAPHRR